MNAYSLSFDPNDEQQMAQFQQLMAELHEAYDQESQSIAKQLVVSLGCALDVQYLRSRSRWTQELEDRLIQLHREGRPPNIFDFGHKEL